MTFELMSAFRVPHRGSVNPSPSGDGLAARASGRPEACGLGPKQRNASKKAERGDLGVRAQIASRVGHA